MSSRTGHEKVAVVATLNRAILNAQASQTIQMDRRKIDQGALPVHQSQQNHALHQKTVR